MAINKEGSAYTFTFAIILVILVGATLATTSMALKGTIKKNVNDKKMMNILASIGLNDEVVTRANAAEQFDLYVKERILVDINGNEVNKKSGEIDPADKTDAFNIDVKKEYKTKVAKLVQKLKNNKEELLAEVGKTDTQYPIYKCVKDNKELYVMPMVGTGLWGPIWGYVAIEDDFNTVYGAAFDHKTETPGLGAEVSINAKKGGASPGSKHEVSGITGGTITSNGVNEMLYRSILIYTRYFKKIKA